jgi:septal ring factor EnvC (AmiA/AmiB activator)
MDASVWIPVIVACVVAAPGVWGAWRQWQADKADLRRKQQRDPGELQQLDADTAQRWQEIADKSAQRIQALEERVDGLNSQIGALQQDLDKARRQEQEWRNGIERLIAQLVSHGLAPVWQPRRLE